MKALGLVFQKLWPTFKFGIETDLFKVCIYGSLMYGKCSKISNTSHLPKKPSQTVQTQIRLLLKKQSDQGLPCL